MTQKVRNLKGGIIQKTDDDGSWYQFSTSIWLLIGGLILFNIGCFVNPGLIDGMFRMLDVRLWPWWYFPMLVLFIAFAVRWSFIYRNWKNYDDLDMEAARRFTRMAVTMIVIMAIFVLMNITNRLLYFYYHLSDWLLQGIFSWVAILTLVMILAVIFVVIYVTKEWLVTFWKD